MARYWRTIDFPSDSRHRRAAVRAQACADRRPGFAEVAAAHALRHAEAAVALIHWRKHHTVRRGHRLTLRLVTVTAK